MKKLITTKMIKEFRIVNEEKRTVQVTTPDERWYCKQMDDKETGLPVIVWKPSITFITSSYPKGIGYIKWVADRGYDKAEEIKIEAGDRGTIVHHAIEKLITEGKLKMDDKIKDREGVEREMTPDEYYCVMTFAQWYETNGKPKTIAVERTVESEKYGYAGTLDYLFELNGENVLVDIKSNKYIFPSHELQVSALKQACAEEELKVDKIAILQVGYLANKSQHYKFTEIEDQFSLFLATKEIWAKEHGKDKPLQRNYPLQIELTPTTSVNESAESGEVEVATEHEAEIAEAMNLKVRKVNKKQNGNF